MNSMMISFADNLIFRQENYGVLVFNKKNSAVLKIAKALFDRIVKGQVPCEEKYLKALKVLHQNDMLIADNKSFSLGEKQRVKEKSTYNVIDGGLFNIKSIISPITALWAITAKCNLKCTYCFPEVNDVCSYSKDLSLEQLQNIAKQIVDAKIFQLTVSGGEAFMLPYLWEVVSTLFNGNIKLTIVSNGTTINADIIKKLKKYELIVGVSLDAPNEEINAITRGKGVFNRALVGMRLLIKEQIPVVALVTLTRFNFPVLLQHIEFLSKLGVKNITLQDLRPFGTKEIYDNFKLTRDQEMQLYNTVKEILRKYREIIFNLSELFIFPQKERKITANGKIMQCPAGDNFAYIDYHGDMYPCTNLTQIKFGNLLRDGSIVDLWKNSEGIRDLRSLKNKKITEISGCSDCSFNQYCDGGCRGDALFYSNRLDGRASRCPELMGMCDTYEEEREYA